jgi:CrcB protein
LLQSVCFAISLLYVIIGGVLEKIFYVAVGGSIGCVSRYGLTLLSVRLFSDRFPFGTLCANLTGCFLIGLIFSLGAEKNIISPSFRLFFVTGFIGGLTTFSTYGIESVNFARSGMMDTTLINIAANNIGGALLIFAGLWLGRVI